MLSAVAFCTEKTEIPFIDAVGKYDSRWYLYQHLDSVIALNITTRRTLDIYLSLSFS